MNSVQAPSFCQVSVIVFNSDGSTASWTLVVEHLATPAPLGLEPKYKCGAG